MASEAGRCEPADPTVSGWYWVQPPPNHFDNTPQATRWKPQIGGWGFPVACDSALAFERGWRLGDPVPNPAELDALVAIAVGWQRGGVAGNCWLPPAAVPRDYEMLPPYTTSADAALTLVPEGWSVLLAIGPKRSLATVHTEPLGTEGVWFDSRPGATPPLAICIAALRTKAAP